MRQPKGSTRRPYAGDPGFNRYDTESVTASLFLTHDFSDALRFEGTARYRDNEAIYQQAWPAFLGDGVPRVAPDGTLLGRSIFGGPAGSTQFAFDARLRARFRNRPDRARGAGRAQTSRTSTPSRNQAFFNLPTTFNIYNPVYDLAGFPSQAEFDGARFFTENETIATDLYPDRSG